MKFSKACALLAGCLGTISASDINRPKIHFTPQHGWMNDPNGLFYDKTAELYHLYFQYNPNDTVWGLPLYWGHATSKDMMSWDEHGVAISPDHDDEGIFSGSIVVDTNNTSGFFNESIDPHQRVVAIYTNNSPEEQTQDIAYLLDGGYTFTKYSENPVISINLTQFRDPKVFWHEESAQWIMVVVQSQEYKIDIYGSVNLKNWVKHSEFTSGYFGMQYECPGLIEVPVEGGGKKWLMILAINPGSPMGGSANQYFIGDFDGFKFTADDTQTRFMDMGHDFYAFQTFSDLPTDDVIGVAWALNWAYAAYVPTVAYRSSMTLPRKLTLKEAQVNAERKELTLCSEAVIPKQNKVLSVSNQNLTTSHPIKTNVSATFSFDLSFTVLNMTVKKSDIPRVDISFGNANETVNIIFDSAVGTFVVNRDIPSLDFNDFPFYSHKSIAYVEPTDGEYLLTGIVDRNILELYYNNGSVVATDLFFMEGVVSEFNVKTSLDGLFKLEALDVHNLKTN